MRTTRALASGLCLILVPLVLAASQAPARPKPRSRRPPAQKPAPEPPPPAPAPADVVVLNGRVFTGAAGAAMAQAVAIRGDRIASVGTSDDVRKLVGPDTKVIDAGDHLVIAGFNDAHTHPGAPLRGTTLAQGDEPAPDPTFKEVLKLVQDAAARSPKGTWLLGHIGAAVLDDPKATRFGLDEVTKDHPVLLRAWTGHGTFLNTAAMRALGIGETDPDPIGGMYTRLKKGGSERTLSGFAHEYAEYRIERKLHESATDAEIGEAFRAFTQQAASFGITSIQAMMTAHDADRVAQALHDVALATRVRLIRFPLTDPATWNPPDSPAPSTPGAMLAVRGTKWILDGTPIERLAFFRQPYADFGNWRGQPNFAPATVRHLAERTLQSGEPQMFHAVGDAAIDELLTAMSAAGPAQDWPARRLRIEHADGLVGDLVGRARALGIVVVQNPTHFALTAVLPARLGAARLGTIQPMKSLVAARIPLAIGSDGPLNPGLNIMLATTHPDNPAEAVSREDALRAYTYGSVYAEFAETDKGTLAPGMLADLAILSQDVLGVAPDALPGTAALTTIVGGRVVFQRERP